MSKRLGWGAVVVATAATSAPVMAQGVVGIEEVIVTAQRRSERLQDVPIAISAFTAESLEQSGIRSSTDLTQITPGLYFAQTAYFAQPTIRGVGTFNTHIGDEANVATYVDGVYMSQMIGGFYQLSNIERIEVLKGPQGTLFGRNATGGAINIITKTPTSQPEFFGQIGYGRFNSVDVQGYASGGGEKVAGNLGGFYSRRDGYVNDLINNKKVGDRDAYMLRSKIKLEASDKLSFTLMGDVSRNNDPAGVLTHVLNRNSPAEPAVNTTAGDYDLTQPVPSSNIITQSGVALQADLQLSAFDIVSLSSYRKVRQNATSDSDASAAALTFFYQHAITIDMAEELRLVSKPESKVQWVAGMFLYGNRASYDPLDVRGAAGGAPIFVLSTLEKTTAVAGYADVTVPVVDKLFLTGGLRYSDETKKFRFQRVPALPTVANGQRPDVSFDSWTPRAVLSYRPTDSAMVYASFSQGFKTGGYNTSSAGDAPYRPEKIDAYEIGAKANLAHNFVVNVAGYHYDYKDLQVQALVGAGGTAVVSNAATARMNGIDADLAFTVSKEFSLHAGVAYLDAKYKSFPLAGLFIPRTTAIPGTGNRSCVGVECDASGKQIPRSPKFTFNIGGNYQQELGGGYILRASANLYHSDSYAWESSGRLKQPSYESLNGQIEVALPGDHLAFAVWGKNLTDARVYNYIAVSGTGDRVSFGDPLTFGFSIRYKM